MKIIIYILIYSYFKFKSLQLYNTKIMSSEKKSKAFINNLLFKYDPNLSFKAGE